MKRPAPLPIRVMGWSRSLPHINIFVLRVLSRGEGEGHDPQYSMPKDEDIIYVITKSDVDDVGKTIGLSKLTDRHYQTARKYLISFCGDGMYTTVTAIADALKSAEDMEQVKQQ